MLVGFSTKLYCLMWLGLVLVLLAKHHNGAQGKTLFNEVAARTWQMEVDCVFFEIQQDAMDHRTVDDKSCLQCSIRISFMFKRMSGLTEEKRLRLQS